MRTIFKKRQEYYKAVAKQKELAEELKESKFKEAINETLVAAIKSEATPVKAPVETDAPVKEKKKPGRKKA